MRSTVAPEVTLSVRGYFRRLHMARMPPLHHHVRHAEPNQKHEPGPREHAHAGGRAGVLGHVIAAHQVEVHVSQNRTRQKGEGGAHIHQYSEVVH